VAALGVPPLPVHGTDAAAAAGAPA
jgi:hypothetical protein